ncbi:MAG: hypothetical protein L0Z07_06265 [Planctomycetes bacterium]|nr:hypothetical protein [Planctomycetota bacterium]
MRNNHKRRHSSSHSCRSAAYSLLEVVLASAICATAIVPALALVRDGVDLADNIDARHQLLLYGVCKMEEQTAVVAAGWVEGTIAGDFAAEGNPRIRFIVSRSDDSASGGIDQRLMGITVTTYRDDDGDGSLDAGELSTILKTKISKLASYEDKASS